MVLPSSCKSTCTTKDFPFPTHHRTPLPMAAQQQNAPICSYSCFQGNQHGAVYKGRKQTAATQSCNIVTFWSRSELPLSPLPFQLHHDSCKGWVTHFTFYNHITAVFLEVWVCGGVIRNHIGLLRWESNFLVLLTENHLGAEGELYQQPKFTLRLCIPSQ